MEEIKDINKSLKKSWKGLKDLHKHAYNWCEKNNVPVNCLECVSIQGIPRCNPISFKAIHFEDISLGCVERSYVGEQRIGIKIEVKLFDPIPFKNSKYYEEKE